MNFIQIVIGVATAAACAYWQHSAGIIARAGCCMTAQFKVKP